MSLSIHTSLISCGVKQILNVSHPNSVKWLIKGCTFRDGVKCSHCKGTGFEPESKPTKWCTKCEGIRFEVVPILPLFLKGWTYLFSDNDQGNGKNFAQAIKDLDLGTIVETPEWNPNPNMGGATKIKVWTWIYNGNVPKESKSAS